MMKNRISSKISSANIRDYFDKTNKKSKKNYVFSKKKFLKAHFWCYNGIFLVLLPRF